MTDHATDKRRIYAAGFYAGLEAAGVEVVPGLSIKEYRDMNAGRFQALHNGLNSLAKKVYAVVPIAEAWNVGQITSELVRQGSRMDLRIVNGCLNTMVSSGLVHEPTAGTFIRVPVRERTPRRADLVPVHVIEEKEPEQIIVSTAVVPAASKSQSIIERLSALATRALQMQEGLRQLAEDIEGAALEIDEQFTASAEDSQKLRQLQAILKSVA